jgi:acetylornithine deacetylase
MDLIEFARSLIDIDSTTGREREAGDWLAPRCGEWATRSPSSRSSAAARTSSRRSAIRWWCSRRTTTACRRSSRAGVEDGKLYGRGACDAKGILAAQVAAAERFRVRGDTRVGLLFVVGEERGSDGAALANTQPIGSRYLINGEPTDSTVASATRGVLRLRLTATGRAAHSAAPAAGESAIEKLIDALVRLRQLPLPADPEFGPTFYNIGTIAGGVAPNVIPAHATAEILFRTVGPPEAILAAVADLEPLVGVQEVLRVPAVRLRTVPGLPAARFRSRPTCRCSIAGASRCCSARARFSWPIPTTSTWPSSSWSRLWNLRTARRELPHTEP